MLQDIDIGSPDIRNIHTTKSGYPYGESLALIPVTVEICSAESYFAFRVCNLNNGKVYLAVLLFIHSDTKQMNGSERQLTKYC